MWINECPVDSWIKPFIRHASVAELAYDVRFPLRNLYRNIEIVVTISSREIGGRSNAELFYHILRLVII